MPRLRGKDLVAAEQQVGQDRPRIQKSTGPARDSLEKAHIEPADGPVNKEWAEQMRMNEEPVEVIVHETTDPRASPIPDIYVDGIPQRFIRGKAQSVKWKFVELLARARETTYSQEKYIDANGTENYRNIPHTALKYPFTLSSTTPQKFHDQLKKVLAEA